MIRMFGRGGLLDRQPPEIAASERTSVASRTVQGSRLPVLQFGCECFT
jgi:hypothetical protein